MSVSDAPHPELERVLFDSAAIQERIRQLGEEISRDYAGRKPVLVGILKGCVLFLSDLLRSVSLDCSVDFMSAASYAGQASTGDVRLLLDLRESVKDKDVLLVEDIVDTGLTLDYLLRNLKTRKLRSLEVCTLLDKPTCRRVPVKVKYTGFEIPNEFVVGYGLDYEERFRNLPYIGVMKSDGSREEASCR